MKKLIFCVVLISIYACSSSKNVTTSNNSESKDVVAAAKVEKDGSTVEKAIVIKAKNESDGVSAEYAMLEKMFPKYKVKSQASTSTGSKEYDLISITTSDNVEKVIVFDITNFYGKF